MKKSTVALVAILICAMLLFVWFQEGRDVSRPIDPIPAAQTNEEERHLPVASQDSAASTQNVDLYQLELPGFTKNDAIVRHFAYTLCYNERYEQASWVAYELTDDELIKRYDRSNRFRVDGAVKTATADDRDYKRSGYDRGHLAPAGDMSWSSVAMEESFYYSNMSPQVPSFNRGIWKRLEEQVRDWAGELGTIYVVTGPVLTGNLRTIGPNSVAVPNYYYKVILDNRSGHPKAIGFIMQNEGSKGSISNYAVSVDQVERFTGIDFFPGLSDKTEQQVESSLCISCWNWNIQRKTRSSSVKNSVAVQCSGITKKGKRCKRMTKDPSGRCYQHD
jgi:endonuclease G